LHEAIDRALELHPIAANLLLLILEFGLGVFLLRDFQLLFASGLVGFGLINFGLVCAASNQR